MKQKKSIAPFVITLLLALLIVFITVFLQGALVQTILEKIFSPAQTTTYIISTKFQSLGSDKKIKELQVENQYLLEKLVNQKELQKENKALKDQFQTAGVNSQTLLPAQVVGAPGFVPGVSIPQYLIINVGSDNNVKKGQAVIVQNIVVGIIESVSKSLSKVRLITSKQSSFTASLISSKKDSSEEVSGIIKGQDTELFLLDNVILSDTIEIKDIVLTKGSLQENGKGYPPNLVVGSIVSIEKKPSALFQSAQVKSPLNFSNLSTVFIITRSQ